MLIKYELDEGACIPMRAHNTDAGFDLSCKEDQVLEPNVANTTEAFSNELQKYTRWLIQKTQEGTNETKDINC